MAIQTLYDTGEDYTVKSKYDGGVYSVAVNDCIIKGIGDEFTINYQSDSLDVYFNAGSQAVIGGSFFKVTELETVRLVPNSTIYLCANINLTNPNGKTGSFVLRTESSMQSDNLNGSGSSRDLLLYIIQTSSSGVTSTSDKRVVQGDSTSISGLGLRVISQSDYDALASKDSNTLYIIPES